MDPLAIGKLLADLGGWTAFVVVTVAAGVGFIKGWIVPARYYDREVTRADKAEVIATRNAEAVEALTLELRQRGFRQRA